MNFCNDLLLYRLVVLGLQYECTITEVFTEGKSVSLIEERKTHLVSLFITSCAAVDNR